MATVNPYNQKNPFEAVKKITGYKGDWHTKYSMGQDTAPSAEAAKPYYDWLRANGYASLADELDKSDYVQAKDILKRYAPDKQASGTDGVSGYLENTMGVIKDFLPNSQNSVTTSLQTGINQNYNNHIGKADSVYADNKKAQDNYGNDLSSLLNRYNRQADTVNVQNMELWNQMKQFGTDQTARYDKLSNYIYNNDYTATPWYNTIMQGYQIQGNNAAGDAIASAGGNNSGNIDSYAAANANRQQVAFTNAGNQAALNAYNSQIGNQLATLQSLGVDIGNLQNRQQANVDSSRADNHNLLTNWNTGQAYLGDMRNANSQNVLNAYGNAGANYNTGASVVSAASAQEQANIDNILNSLLTTYGNLYNTDSNERINSENNQNAIDLQKLANQLGIYQIDSGERQNTENNATTLTQQQMLNDLGFYQTDSSERQNAATNNATIARQQLENEAAYYKAQTENETKKYIAQLEHSIANASGKSGEDTTMLQITEDFETLLTDIGPSQGLSYFDIGMALKRMYPTHEKFIDELITDYKSRVGFDYSQSSSSTSGNTTIPSDSTAIPSSTVQVPSPTTAQEHRYG